MPPRSTGALCEAPGEWWRASYDGYKRKKGGKVHAAVATLCNLLALTVTPANEQERAQVAALAGQVRASAGQSVELAYLNQGYTGKEAAEAASAYGIQSAVVKTARATRTRQPNLSHVLDQIRVRVQCPIQRRREFKGAVSLLLAL